MKIAVLKETIHGENRVASTPDAIKKLLKKFPDLEFIVEKNAGELASISDTEYKEAGAKSVTHAEALKANIILTVNPLDEEETASISKDSILIGNLNPFASEKLFKELANSGVNAVAMEKIPRISRAQAMDTLSSQANIGGYRAVIEGVQHLNKFMPMMMTAAGSSKPAKIIILGVGVAGLQAIATAKRLGGAVEAFDVRPEVKEQVQSLGAKFIELDLGESGSGEGGYAKELSDEAKKKQQDALQEVLKKADMVITTAQIPGRPAPELVTKDAVKGMADGSVIVDMATGGYNQAHAIAGGNCKLSEADKVVVKDGVTIVGWTNYPTMMAKDASSFYARNILNFLQLLLAKDEKTGETIINYNLEDEIIAKSLAVYNGEVK